MAGFEKELEIEKYKHEGKPYCPRPIDINAMLPGENLKVWFGKEKYDPFMQIITGKVRVDEYGNRYLVADKGESLLKDALAIQEL